MIVKKIPILQGFPAPDTVNYLSNVKNKLSENSAIFYDIETTGLSRYTASVYLIGAVRYEKNQWILYQWMAENAEEEASVFCAASFADSFLDHLCGKRDGAGRIGSRKVWMAYTAAYIWRCFVSCRAVHYGMDV